MFFYVYTNIKRICKNTADETETASKTTPISSPSPTRQQGVVDTIRERFASPKIKKFTNKNREPSSVDNIGEAGALYM